MKRVATFLLAAGLVFAVAAPALAAPPSSDPTTDAQAAAAWLASKVNASGFIPQTADPTKANLSLSVQAVTAIASAGVGKAKVTALLGYLGDHTEALVAPAGADDPGALAYLILAAKAGGLDPTSFGTTHTNLVTRLVGTQRSANPDAGLFGAADASFDGATRQGLALLALHAAGVSNPAGVAWLEGQQCADGSFNAYRADTSIPCPAIDPVNFVGSDTNSTAFAVMGLATQGDTTAAGKGVTELGAVRNAGGGWGFAASSTQTTDANSTGVVLEALRTATGSVDTQGVAALLALQIGCDAKAADRGALQFQATKGADLFATVQATPALAGVPLPITPGTMSDGVPTVCPTVVTSTTSTTVAASGSTVTTVGATGSTTAGTVAAAAELPRTGSSSSAPIAIGAVSLLAVGGLLVGGARRRRA